jgi:hypothetical protein
MGCAIATARSLTMAETAQNRESLKGILSKLNKEDLLPTASSELNPPTHHNQEDIGDRFSQLTDKLCEYRLEVARQLVTMAENNLRQTEAEVHEMRAAMKHKWEEYQALMRLLEDASSESMAVGRKLSNGMIK